jgi:hypothetical protein
VILLGELRLFLFSKFRSIQMDKVISKFNAIKSLVLNQRGDDYGEKAVILVLVVLGGVAAFAAFGGKIVEMITAATGGM